MMRCPFNKFIKFKTNALIFQNKYKKYNKIKAKEKKMLKNYYRCKSKKYKN